MYVRQIPRWARILAYLVVTLLAIIYILPYLWMIMSSFRPASDPFAMGIFPRSLTLVNYINTLKNSEFLLSFVNSIKVAGLAAVFTLLFGIPAGYGFARFKFRGSNSMMGFLILVRSFPGILLAIALFVMAVKMGLYDSHVPLIAANTIINLPFAIWNLRSVFEATSREMEESAMVEGCNRLQSLIRILLPISLPGLASTFAFVFILSWNEYLFATNFIMTSEKRLITTMLASAIGQFNVNYALLIPAAILSTIPMIGLFLLIQRYIIKGLSMGSIKG
ncbi:MAG TPA: carbohydrate ABC transporter permease [Anaerolineaceae bacterium]|nr:carbohydrate ABC transporter permease [Anaerolineaceae bacterium]